MDGSDERGVDCSRHGGQQLPDIGADPTARGRQGKGVVDDPRQLPAHQPAGESGDRGWPRALAPLGWEDERAVSAMPRHTPQMMKGIVEEAPIQKMSNNPST